ncbi:MAG: response regulator [Candidatus Hodarchaeales archaeon]
MLVDDNKDLLDLYSLIFKRNNYERIDRAEDGDEAVQIYSELNEKPEFILLDYRMPRLNGIDTARQIFQINSECIIIMMSADTTVIEEALKMGIKGFIKKPVEVSEFLKQIKEILAR